MGAREPRTTSTLVDGLSVRVQFIEVLLFIAFVSFMRERGCDNMYCVYLPNAQLENTKVGI